MQIRFLVGSCILSLVVYSELAAQQPRFLAIRAPLNSRDDTLVSYDADGNPIADVVAAPGVRLKVFGDRLYSGGLNEVYDRPMEGGDPFQLLLTSPSEIVYTFGLDDSGSLYVPHAAQSNKIDKYDFSGQQLGQIALNTTYHFQGLAVDSNGDIYVNHRTNPSTNGPATISRLSSSGQWLSEATINEAFVSTAEIDPLNRRLYVGYEPGGIGVYDISGATPVWVEDWDVPGLELLLDISFDGLTGHVFASGIGGVFEVDANGAALVRNGGSDLYFSGVVALQNPNGIGADLNGDLDLDVVDLDALTRAILGGSSNMAFDFSANGIVDDADRDAWLALAAAENLPNGQTYEAGDANLDGAVDGADFAIWNDHKFTRLAAWSKGDFNGDGFVDGGDFILWNKGKVRSFAAGNPIPVPEPGCAGWLGLLMVLVPELMRSRV